MLVYKYFSSDRIDVIEKNLIRFTQGDAFNDPFETLPYIEALITQPHLQSVLHDNEMREVFDRGIMEHIHEHKEWSKFDAEQRSELKKMPQVVYTLLEASFGLNPSLIEDTTLDPLSKEFRQFIADKIGEWRPEIQNIIKNSYAEKLGMLCLSEKPDVLLMWSHYADQHKGFVVEFDTDSDFFEEKQVSADDLRLFRKVQYESERPSVSLSSMPDERENRFTHLINSFLLTKSDHWNYEKEWRLIDMLERADETRQNISPPVYLFKLPPKAISAVVLGCRTSPNEEEKIKSLLRDNRYSHVSLKRATLDERHFKLNIGTV